MATSIIGAEVGDDFTVLATWESTQQGTFSAPEIGQARAEGFTSIQFSGATTTPTNRWELIAFPGDEHGGVEAAGPVILEAGAGYCLYYRGDDALVEDIELDANAGIMVFCRDAGEYEMNRMLCHDSDDAVSTLSTAPTSFLCTQSFFWDISNRVTPGDSGTKTRYVFENVTALAAGTDPGSTVTGFANCVCKNVACFHFGPGGGSSDFNGLDSSSDFLASHDASAETEASTTFKKDLVAANELADVTGALDLHIISGGGNIEGEGTDLSNGPDVDGDALVNISIGGDDGAVAAGGAAPVMMMQYRLRRT